MSLGPTHFLQNILFREEGWGIRADPERPFQAVQPVWD